MLLKKILRTTSSSSLLSRLMATLVSRCDCEASIAHLTRIHAASGPYEMCNPLHGWDTDHWECLTYCETPPQCAPWSTQKSHADWMGPTCFCGNGLSNRTVGRLAQTESHHSKPTNKSNPWPSACEEKGMFEISLFDKCLNGTVMKRVIGPNATAAGWSVCSACAVALRVHCDRRHAVVVGLMCVLLQLRCLSCDSGMRGLVDV